MTLHRVTPSPETNIPSAPSFHVIKHRQRVVACRFMYVTLRMLCRATTSRARHVSRCHFRGVLHRHAPPPRRTPGPPMPSNIAAATIICRGVDASRHATPTCRAQRHADAATQHRHAIFFSRRSVWGVLWRALAAVHPPLGAVGRGIRREGIGGERKVKWSGFGGAGGKGAVVVGAAECSSVEALLKLQGCV